ncbi:sugar transporter SWEET1 isoform X2 [Polyergus mexicanus]|uniref:sugar transporter SWEET1 isoform X2 n=1 Tax=Polyergus mexicanus TaxID=615972 RepID=UPI0038B62359
MVLEQYKEIVGSCAMYVTMAQMLAGTLICKDIYKKGTAKGTDPMPFLGGIGLCILMLRYALMLNDATMINVNIFGLLTNIIYMIVYYYYAPNTREVLKLIYKKEVIKTKSTEILPFPLIFTGTLVSFLWFLYGLIINNVFVIFQNAVGFILCIIQLSLFVIFPSKKSKIGLSDERKED